MPVVGTDRRAVPARASPPFQRAVLEQFRWPKKLKSASGDSAARRPYLDSF